MFRWTPRKDACARGLFRIICSILLLLCVVRTFIAMQAADTITCNDYQTVTNLEPMLDDGSLRYLVTGDKGRKDVTPLAMAKEDISNLRVGSRYCFKPVHAFNWDRFYSVLWNGR